MCDVPSIAVFCSESIECFPGVVSKFLFIIIIIIITKRNLQHYRFHPTKQALITLGSHIALPSNRRGCDDDYDDDDSRNST